jgi:hypothetical protein
MWVNHAETFHNALSVSIKLHLMLKLALFNRRCKHFSCLVIAEGYTGRSIDESGAEPSVEIIQDFIAGTSVLFCKHSSDGIGFHCALN